MDKKNKRICRAAKTRRLIANSGALRLTVHRTAKHIYAQIVDDSSGRTLVYCSSLMSGVCDALKSTGNIESAKVVGKNVALYAVEKGIDKVAFDRSGFKYHGRVKALADAAREFGLKF